MSWPKHGLNYKLISSLCPYYIAGETLAIEIFQSQTELFPLGLHSSMVNVAPMESIANDPSLLQHLGGKTAIVTGGSNGIGAQTVKLFSFYGSNVVIADLESTAMEAEGLIASLPRPKNALFVPTNILNWEQMKLLFRRTIEHFGSVDVVVANAGIMESRSVFDLRAVDDEGELQESLEGFRVLDVNLKGTLNSKSF